MVAVVTKTAAEGREGARGSRRCWPRLCLFKGRTWLITVLLKTLIFISNPDGIASLAYLLAGLAVFCFCFFFGWTCYLTVIYSAQGFRAVLWGKRVMVIIYQSTQFIECLLLFQESAREAPPGSSWRPRAGLASSPVPHPLPRPPAAAAAAGPRRLSVLIRVSSCTVFQSPAACSLASGDARRVPGHGGLGGGGTGHGASGGPATQTLRHHRPAAGEAGPPARAHSAPHHVLPVSACPPPQVPGCEDLPRPR